MDGPLFKPGASMKEKVDASKWSDKEDTQKAREFLRVSHGFDGDFTTRRNLAAKAFGYNGGYSEMPHVLRSAISHLGAVARKNKAAVKKSKENSLADARIHENLRLAGKDWINQVRENERFQRDMTDPEIVGPESAKRNEQVLRPSL